MKTMNIIIAAPIIIALIAIIGIIIHAWIVELRVRRQRKADEELRWLIEIIKNCHNDGSLGMAVDGYRYAWRARFGCTDKKPIDFINVT